MAHDPRLNLVPFGFVEERHARTSGLGKWTPLTPALAQTEQLRTVQQGRQPVTECRTVCGDRA